MSSLTPVPMPIWPAFVALIQPGDTVLSMNLAHGGHLSHGSPVNISGKYFHIVPYGVEDDTEVINYDKVMELAKACRPKLILAGASAYPGPLTLRNSARLQMLSALI